MTLPNKLKRPVQRLVDLAKALPWAGCILIFIPLLWPKGEADGATWTSTAAIYLFAIWAMLILAAGILSWAVQRDRS